MSIKNPKILAGGGLTAALYVAVLSAALASPSAWADNKYRAFYYDAESRLLQVEDVPDAELVKRKLVDVDDSVMTIPMLTRRSTPLISGENIPMSRFAVLAVYYTYDEAGQQGPAPVNSDVPAFPDKVEYLGFIGDRTLASCVARKSTDPCLFPARCHCTTKSCCCY